MGWARDYYSAQSETFARGVVTPTHESIAERMDGWCRHVPECRRILELGAGMGGVASCLANRGYEVTAIEFNAPDADHARRLARNVTNGTLHVVEDDFYTVVLDGQFDFIYYWDGFGVGDDEDQRRLLTRIGREWLSAHGLVFLDVYSPWNWKQRHGETSEYTARDGSAWERRIEFDEEHSRFIDHWQPLPGRAVHRSQTLRCYKPRELHDLMDCTGLQVQAMLGVDGRELRSDGRCDEAEQAYLESTNGFYAVLETADSCDS